MSKRRVLRGGSYYGTMVLRTNSQGWSEPEDRHMFGGFRIVVKRRKP